MKQFKPFHKNVHVICSNCCRILKIIIIKGTLVNTTIQDKQLQKHYKSLQKTINVSKTSFWKTKKKVKIKKRSNLLLMMGNWW